MELAGAVKSTSQLGLLLDDVKSAMKPIHKAVKEVSRIIDQSPWSHLTVRGATSNLPVPTSMSLPTMPLPVLPSVNSLLMSLPHPSLPGPINTSVAPSYAASAASTPGYVTPVPATPLSAALGPAAQATVPTTPSQQLPAINVFERSIGERLLQYQQQQQGTMQRRV